MPEPAPCEDAELIHQLHRNCGLLRELLQRQRRWRMFGLCREASLCGVVAGGALCSAWSAANTSGGWLLLELAVMMLNAVVLHRGLFVAVKVWREATDALYDIQARLTISCALLARAQHRGVPDA